MGFRSITACYYTNLPGKIPFWIGVPIGIMAFCAIQRCRSPFGLPLCGVGGHFLGIGVAWGILQRANQPWSTRTQGSFLLASMVGNTGYIGYPIALALVGPHYFAWAVFYDMLGSTLGSYGLGVALASRLGGATQESRFSPLLALIKNPALWSFALGLACRNLPLPTIVETSLRNFAWFVVSLSLILVGMQLSQLSSLSSVRPAMVSVGIKMLLVPLVVGSILWVFGITGPVHRVLLLQMAMPPAFATLIISEAYELDREFAVTALVAGSLSLLVTLPIWLWLFEL